MANKSISSQIADLKVMTIIELQNRYKKLFDTKETPCDNKVFLAKRISYKLQEAQHGGLSDAANTKISELIAKYDPINNKALRPQVISAGQEIDSLPFSRDKRLPIPGTIIKKKYKNQELQVKVLEKGFEYKNTYYKTLSAIAEEITKAHWNGYNFFNL